MSVVLELIPVREIPYPDYMLSVPDKNHSSEGVERVNGFDELLFREGEEFSSVFILFVRMMKID